MFRFTISTLLILFNLIIEKEITKFKTEISTSGLIHTEIEKEVTDLNKIDKIYYGLLGAGIVLFAVSFVLLNAWVSRKCKQAEISNPVHDQRPQQSGHVIDIGNIHQHTEYNLVHYEIINENDMFDLPRANEVIGIEPNKEQESDLSTSEGENDVSISSSSDRSYLEVIDDYYTPYLTVQSASDPHDIHIYSVPLAENLQRLENSNTKKSTLVHSRSKSI